MRNLKDYISKTIGTMDMCRIYFYQRLFGGYVFEDGEPDSDLMVIFSKSKEFLREALNEDDDIFSIDYSGSEARIRVREDWIRKDGDQVHFGCAGSGFSRIDVWSSDKDGIENIINKFFRINPIGEDVMIEPPIGYDDSENIVYID